MDLEEAEQDILVLQGFLACALERLGGEMVLPRDYETPSGLIEFITHDDGEAVTVRLVVGASA